MMLCVSGAFLGAYSAGAHAGLEQEVDGRIVPLVQDVRKRARCVTDVSAGVA